MKKQLCTLLAGFIVAQAIGVTALPAHASEELRPQNTEYTLEVSPNVDYNLNIGWQFYLPDYASYVNPTQGKS